MGAVLFMHSVKFYGFMQRKRIFHEKMMVNPIAAGCTRVDINITVIIFVFFFLLTDMNKNMDIVWTLNLLHTKRKV